MTTQSTIDKLIEMRLTSMSDAFRTQLEDPKMKEIPFEDRFGMLVDIEYSNRKSNSLKRLIRGAGFDQPDAYIGDINYTSGRKLNLLMLSWAVMISLCHADMRLPGYLSWNVSFDGADLSAPSRKELVHTSMLCQHFKRRDDGTGICLFHSAVMPEAFLIPEEICQ